MPKVSELTGTPWHVEKLTRKEGDARRHKSRCKYYRKKDSYCKFQYIECSGSRYCKYYEVNKIESENNSIDVTAQKKDVIEKISDAEGKKTYPIGSKVRHIKFGDGYIVDLSDGHIIIDFDEVGEKTLGLDICVTKGYLEIIEKAVIAEKVENEVSEALATYDDETDQQQNAERGTVKKGKFGGLGKLLSGLFKRGKKE